LNWRTLFALVILAGLALSFAPAHSQTSSTSGVANVSVDHFYIITPYGFGVLNDSFTFTNPSNSSTAQIQPIQVSLPSNIATRTVGVVLSPSDQFSVSQSSSNGTTVLTITPDQPTLNAGASATVALKAVLNNIMNYTHGSYTNAAKFLVLVSPGLNTNVTTLKSTIILPTGGAFTQAPLGFASPVANATAPAYVQNQTAVQPRAFAEYLNFTDTNQNAFTPITVNSLVREIVPAANGVPMVQDTFTIYNIAAYDVSEIHLYLLNPALTEVTVLPSTSPPLLNPQITDLGSGDLAFASNSLSSELLPNTNLTLTVEYALPPAMMHVSGSAVTITIPYSPVIAAPVLNYSIILAPASGVSPTGQTSILDKTVTPFTPGNVVFTYNVSVGWAADQAIPAGVFVFAVGFALFAIQKKPETEEEEEMEEKGVRRVADVLNAFEEKTGLESQYMEELASAPKGKITRADFDRMRTEISDLRSRALQRLAEMKQELGSGKQFDLLTRVVEAEKEEDRAFRDYLNLYQQYFGSRMNEETYRRLQPNYRKRVDSAINRLSDLLHETQTEEK
jgi:hypothetical protein